MEVDFVILVLLSSYLITSVGLALYERGGGAEFNGLWLMEDDCGQLLLPQSQHI